MVKASLEVSIGNILLSLTPKRLAVCTLRTDIATGNLVALHEQEIDTHLSSYEQIRQAGLALVRFAELLS
jgi:hypothetical protein